MILLTTCGAEVQKGNAPTERKIQRLFRRPEVTKLIRKCNDFGAGGVSVAVGELADGLLIDLDKVTKKYEGLDGTELAISESQERMAVVLDKNDVDTFLSYASEENLEATPIAEVTKEKRLVMKWRDKVIVDISREFLDTNGAHQKTTAAINSPSEPLTYGEGFVAQLRLHLSRISGLRLFQILITVLREVLLRDLTHLSVPVQLQCLTVVRTWLQKCSQ